MVGSFLRGGYFLTLSPCGRGWRASRDASRVRGYAPSMDLNPSPALDASHRVHPLPQGERVKGDRVRDTIHFSAMRFKLARPVAKSLPIMWSMFMNTCITFDIKGAGPCINH